jgi:predicted transposase YbfD/YdcC
VIKRKIKTKTKRTTETAYFISSLPSATKAKVFYDGIRNHWQIENSLHYVKDVTFREDRSRIRTGNSPQNKSLIIDIVMNIFRKNNYTNMAQAIRLVGNDIKLMWKMILA